MQVCPTRFPNLQEEVKKKEYGSIPFMKTIPLHSHNPSYILPQPLQSFSPKTICSVPLQRYRRPENIRERRYCSKARRRENRDVDGGCEVEAWCKRIRDHHGGRGPNARLLRLRVGNPWQFCRRPCIRSQYSSLL